MMQTSLLGVLITSCSFVIIHASAACLLVLNIHGFVIAMAQTVCCCAVGTFMRVGDLAHTREYYNTY
jgi:hypothetical protein